MSRRVAVLALSVRSDVFLGDGGLTKLGRTLESAGHSVTRIDGTWPTEAAARETFLASLEVDLAQRSLDAVVMPRAWDATTLEVIRRAIGPAAKLVRLGTVGAALDDRFDLVTDEQGVRELIDGRPLTEKTRPKNAREARALRVLDVDAGPETAGSRPALSGPSKGCPYLVDAAQLAPFAALALDRSSVQTRGCTFCLDNTGVYVASTEDETVGRWLDQLRSVRASSPSGRIEVLLTDERPHPFLPRFFREVAADAALAPVELLIKSRVDWLMEFEAQLAEAATLAESSGSVLHVYLVGFESFDAETLVLFNKGTSVEDNLRAIDLLRDLARRFPKSFEHQRLRAHGFVAFTPWTSPEGLLRNAATMREVRFDELRSDAARTRLRLYPRTPLHALAQADGLLSDDFGTRTDRAAEQGYDASYAWRFRDPRVEAIYAACEGLRVHTRDLEAADVLELATRFVLRWPGLADAASDAHLPLLAAMRSWDVDARDVGTTLCAGVIVDLELERIAHGEKDALLKEGVPLAQVEGLVRAYRAMGLASDIVERHGVDATGGRHRAGDALAIVAVAKDDAHLARVIELQRARDTRAMGALMGYPDCCAEAFAAQPDRRDNAENERWTLRRSGEAIVHPLAARLGRVRLISHHPCRVDCAATISIAERAIDRVAATSVDGAAWIRRALDRSALFLDHARWAVVDGEADGARMRVHSIEALPGRELGIPLDDVTELEVHADRVLLRTARGEARTVRADRALLVTPGRAFPRELAASIAIPASPSPRVEHPLRWLELTPDYRCNQRCLGCGVMNEGGPSRSSRDLVLSLSEGRARGITQLWLGGGEPTLRPDMLPLIRRARSLGYTRVRLQTNAAMLAYPEVTARLVDAGVTEIAVSIKGADAATHDRFARTEGAFDLMCRGIANARAASLSVEGDVLLYRSTTASLPAIVSTFFALGVVRFRVWMMAPDPSDPDALAEEPKLSEVARAIEGALALGLSDDPEHVVSLHTPPCTLTGHASRARFFAPDLGLMIHDASGARFRLEESAIEGGVFVSGCDGCALRSRCGGARAGYLARHGHAELVPERAP